MRWHRRGFALDWRWRSSPRRAGRPARGRRARPDPAETPPTRGARRAFTVYAPEGLKPVTLHCVDGDTYTLRPPAHQRARPDDGRTVHGARARDRSPSAPAQILAVGNVEAEFEPRRHGRLQRARGDAGPCERAHARADDAAAWTRRRSAPRRLADGLHDAGRAGVRAARFRRARHEARLRGDDSVRHDVLRRHVLLRGSRGRSHGGGRSARALRADGAQVPRARRRQLRGRAGPRARVHRALEGAPADRPGGRAARALHLHRRRSSGRAPSWPASSTCRCTLTWPKRRSRSSSPGASTACPSCRGSRNSGCSTRACWPPTACTWTKERYGR